MRYLVAAPVRGRGWFQHPDRPKFLTHSGALMFANRAIRLDAAFGKRRIEWHPVKSGQRVRNTVDETWPRARDLPVWPGD